MTSYVSKDFAAVTVLADTSATEMDATNAKGWYVFDLAQAETNADTLLFTCKSATANIVCLAFPAVVYTTPPNFGALGIGSNGHITTVDTCTTNSDMRGTDSAALASVWTNTRGGYVDNLSAGAVALASVCTDARLAHLDADVSSRSTYAGGDTAGTTTLLVRVPGVVQPQTGDSYARLGAAGAGLTALGDTRIANLDAAVSSRMATYTQPTGFLAATFPDDPADESLVIAATTAIMTRLGVPVVSVSADVAGVQTGVTTLLGRITSTLFSGITYLSRWLGLLAGKTADASTLAEVNATTGGASYVNTTDSLEALRDRGDAAWGGLDTAGVRAAVGLASANLDTQFGAVSLASVCTETRLAKLDTTGVVRITVVSPVASSGDVGPLLRGDDYYNADSRALAWTLVGMPNLTSALSVTLTTNPPSGSEFSKAVTVTVAGSGDQALRLELSAAESEAMTVGSYAYEIVAVLASGHRCTLVRGTRWTVTD